MAFFFNVLTINENQVTKISNIKYATLNKHFRDGRGFSYYVALRAAGGSDPDYATVLDEGTLLFQANFETEEIAAAPGFNFDLYIICSDGLTEENPGKLVARWTDV